ncbi:N-acetylmuramoyl-L-alanine amidase [Collimonas sp. OK412]|jgi:N-acetylmuramoyl-L-alanine amidase|uniref:N-acetylmuramoyl-L-alanine amidase n=1 Tax=Collimonas sp. (strain OK412) TaxID=1801619 RepID=UPI0008EC4EC3|nr:N-acetylmuramoyl-L-alanine amidase [Collimonas sp. OK412]SFB83087.1 N-acetylmuramoyl-L-alanine amidase [Collimonas sp. OK412]
MSKAAIRRLLLATAGLVCCYGLPLARCNAQQVVVDTGHTTENPGAAGPGGIREFDLNRQFTVALGKALQAEGLDVVDVAASGSPVSLQARTKASAKAALFVSIHHDSMQQAWLDAGRSREFSGYALFVAAGKSHYARSLDCAKSISLRLQDIGEHPSLYHATPIRGENRPLLDRQLGIHRFDDLVVLKTAESPALLIEIGVLANPDQEPRLASPQFAGKAARAVAAGIRQCLPAAP